MLLAPRVVDAPLAREAELEDAEMVGQAADLAPHGDVLRFLAEALQLLLRLEHHGLVAQRHQVVDGAVVDLELLVEQAQAPGERCSPPLAAARDAGSPLWTPRLRLFSRDPGSRRPSTSRSPAASSSRSSRALHLLGQLARPGQPCRAAPPRAPRARTASAAVTRDAPAAACAISSLCSRSVGSTCARRWARLLELGLDVERPVAPPRRARLSASFDLLLVTTGVGEVVDVEAPQQDGCVDDEDAVGEHRVVWNGNAHVGRWRAAAAPPAAARRWGRDPRAEARSGRST